MKVGDRRRRSGTATDYLPALSSLKAQTHNDATRWEGASVRTGHKSLALLPEPTSEKDPLGSVIHM